MPDTITSAELMRRFEEVARRLDTLATNLETGYVRKDAHDQSIRAIEAMHVSGIRLIESRMESDRNAAERSAADNAQDIKDLKAERTRDLAWKRQVTAMLITAGIGLTGTFGIAVFNLLAGG